MTNASKAAILEMGKKQAIEFYQELTQEQQQQFKEFPQKLREAKTMTEMHELAEPVYLQMKQNQTK